jgi:hypothetical protein
MGGSSIIGRVGLVWGVGGVALLLVDALVRLAPIASEALAQPLSGLHWFFLIGWTSFMLFVEGYRGFHSSFSPRVVARALHLRERPRPLDVALAPFFCMGLYRTTRRRLIAGWGMAAGIVSLILLVRTLAQPWRGLVDLGVLVALGFGLISTLFWLVRGLAGKPLPFSPELGEASDRASDSAPAESDSRVLGRARMS